MGITDIIAALHGNLEDEMQVDEQARLGSNHSTTVFFEVRPHWTGTNLYLETTRLRRL